MKDPTAYVEDGDLVVADKYGDIRFSYPAEYLDKIPHYFVGSMIKNLKDPLLLGLMMREAVRLKPDLPGSIGRIDAESVGSYDL